MRFSLLAFLALAAAPAAAAAAPSGPELGESLQAVDAYVYHCHDGDTCRVRIAEAVWLNIRLAGIDAPEVGGGRKRAGQPMGDQARDFLNGAIKGKTVKLRQLDLDQYNRPVVELTLGDKKINEQLVAEGWAEVYRGKAKRLDRAPYEAAEAEAKKAKKGIWSLSSYESPKDFRKAARAED
jgi:endonuclease YncB( thermonuclease family)